MLMVFSIYDEKDQYNIEFLENYANINLIPEVKRVNGVGDAMVLGQDYSMRIWLKPDVMAQYKLIPNDVVAGLSEQNIEAAPGQLGERGNKPTSILCVTKDVCNRLRSSRTLSSRPWRTVKYSV